jgi:colanic acid/amylovoran biosynthesis glycosyltransferase
VRVEPDSPRAPAPGEPLRITVLVDHYPALSETFVLNEIHSLQALGHDVHVETGAWARDAAPDRGKVPVACMNEDGLGRRLRDLAWLVSRHPVGAARDLLARRRWSSQERVRPWRVLAPVVRRISLRGTQHLHAHFAAGVALDAMRVQRLLGIPYSVTAHAYDIYRAPANLEEKLARSAFSTGECEYSVRDLRAIAGPGHAPRVHVVTMGVDHGHFRRTAPYPGGRRVLAVGRLVEKKGFRHLLDAAALLQREAPLDRLVIVGDGPLREELHAQASELGLDGVVEWRGARDAAGVRDELERADVVAISAVFVADGDRDVLPLIAGEALAMEVPVVASDMVGLPEVVMPPWGRLVPPGDARALADGLADVLSLPTVERIGMGRTGRDFVVRTRDLRAAAEHLVDLIRQYG